MALVKAQRPQAPKLEVWNYGTVRERVPAADARWTWKGAWRTDARRPTRISAEKGAEASITFTGTGAIVSGPFFPEGGKADVYLDGKFSRTVDACSDERNGRTGEAVWHAFALKNGTHTVRLVVRGEPYGAYKGADVGIDDLIVFR
jgi:hypothetical protein